MRPLCARNIEQIGCPGGASLWAQPRCSRRFPARERRKPCRRRNRRFRRAIAEFVTGFDLKARRRSPSSARAAGLRRYRRRDACGLDREGRRDRARDGAAEGAPAVSVIGSPLETSPQLAALANWRRLARARFRFHLHAGPVDGAGDPGAAAARRSRPAPLRPSRCGLHRRLRGLLAASPRQPDAQRRGPLARHLDHRRDQHRGGLRAAVEAAGGDLSPT